MRENIVKTKSSWGRTPGISESWEAPLFVLLLRLQPRSLLLMTFPQEQEGSSEVVFWKQETVISKSIN